MDSQEPQIWPMDDGPAKPFCAEDERLKVMASYGLDDLDGDQELANLARFAAKLCEAPIGLVSLVEEERQRFLAHEGLDESETPRSMSFCAYAMLGHSLTLIRDTLEDPTFADNDLVTGPPHIRFYAGIPLISEEGAPLGTLCVIDREPRPKGLNELQIEGLKTLAQAVRRRLYAHRQELGKNKAIARSEERLRQVLDSLPQIACAVRSDGEFVYYNAQFDEFTGAERPKDVDGWRELLHEDDREDALSKWADALRDKRVFENEARIRRHDGEWRWMLVRVVPALSESAEDDLWFGLLIDIHETRNASEAIIARLQALANSIPDIAWIADPDGEVTYMNNRWYEFTGLDETQLNNAYIFENAYHPDDRHVYEDQWSRSVKDGSDFEAEMRVRRHDGEWRWLLSRGVPVKDSAGNVLEWFGTLTDIDDTHRQKEERELLAGELAHRIKNIFSVIAGLITLRSRGNEKLESFGQELSAAIRALGRAQDFVRPLKSEESDELVALLEILMAPYQDGEGKRVAIAGDRVKVGPRAATPLALIFHELATNAAKYGSLSREEGSVSIAINKAPDSVSIVWQERGGPEAKEPTVGGFGSRLIDMATCNQLGGSLEKRWEKQGLSVSITLPLDRIQP